MTPPDPHFPQTWNRYAYALNDPLTYTDPTGLFAVVPAGCVGTPNADPETGDYYICGDTGLPGFRQAWDADPGDGGGGGGGASPAAPAPTQAITTKTPRGRSCGSYGAQVNFLAANLAGAAAAAATLNTSPANLLGLAAYESGYGADGPARFANNTLGLSAGFPMSGPSWYDQGNGFTYSSFATSAQAFASFAASSWGAMEYGAALGADFAPRLDPLGGRHYSSDSEIAPAQYIQDITCAIMTAADLLACVH